MFRWTPARGETTAILGSYMGVHLGYWLLFQVRGGGQKLQGTKDRRGQRLQGTKGSRGQRRQGTQDSEGQRLQGTQDRGGHRGQDRGQQLQGTQDKTEYLHRKVDGSRQGLYVGEGEMNQKVNRE